VYVVDPDSLTSLPVDLFDGSSFGAGIRQLENEWKAVLSQPAVKKKSGESWLTQRLSVYDTKIATQELMIKSLRSLLEQVSWLSATQERKCSLAQRYQSALVTYESQLARTIFFRKQLVAGLSRIAGR